MSDIDALRAEIDRVDEAIVALLNERARCAIAIGALKERTGEPVYQPAREAQVLAHISGANGGPLDDGAVRRLFERVIDETRRIERLAAQHGRDGKPGGS